MAATIPVVQVLDDGQTRYPLEIADIEGVHTAAAVEQDLTGALTEVAQPEHVVMVAADDAFYGAQGVLVGQPVVLEPSVQDTDPGRIVDRDRDRIGGIGVVGHVIAEDIRAWIVEDPAVKNVDACATDQSVVFCPAVELVIARTTVEDIPVDSSLHEVGMPTSNDPLDRSQGVCKAPAVPDRVAGHARALYIDPG